MNGAVAFAQALGVSELVIGLTIVAAGTSLPEVATSILAALRGERDIAVGNVVGSNIFNLLAVLGLSSLVAPGGLPAPAALLRFDLPVIVAVALACLPIFASGAVIARWEGALFLFYYAAYTAYLVLAAQQHDALPAFSAVMEAFVLPADRGHARGGGLARLEGPGGVVFGGMLLPLALLPRRPRPARPGDALVHGASAIAARLGSRPRDRPDRGRLGPSAPELAVSLGAALRGQSDIALGNVVGSNIFNVLGVLGASALVAPLFVSRRLVRLDVPILIALSGAVYVLALDHRIGSGRSPAGRGGRRIHRVRGPHQPRRGPGRAGGGAGAGAGPGRPGGPRRPGPPPPGRGGAVAGRRARSSRAPSG